MLTDREAQVEADEGKSRTAGSSGHDSYSPCSLTSALVWYRPPWCATVRAASRWASTTSTPCSVLPQGSGPSAGAESHSSRVMNGSTCGKVVLLRGGPSVVGDSRHLDLKTLPPTTGGPPRSPSSVPSFPGNPTLYMTEHTWLPHGTESSFYPCHPRRVFGSP